MATAPKPGARQREERKRVGLQIRVRENKYTLYVADLGPNDDLVARKETGLPVTPFFAEERFGMDSLLMMYWMARRKNGEPNLRFQTVLEEFPTYESVSDGDVEVTALEDENTDPEDGADPLP